MVAHQIPWYQIIYFSIFAEPIISSSFNIIAKSLEKAENFGNFFPYLHFIPFFLRTAYKSKRNREVRRQVKLNYTNTKKKN